MLGTETYPGPFSLCNVEYAILKFLANCKITCMCVETKSSMKKHSKVGTQAFQINDC